MNSFKKCKPLVILAVVVAVALGALPGVEAQTDSPAPNDNPLPPGIDSSSPVAQVIKLTQAGSDVSVVNAYVANSASPFNLDADTIITLKDAGVPTDVINEMMTHDKDLSTTATTTPAPEPAPAPAPTPDTTTAAPPPDNTPAPDNTTVTDDQPDTAPPAVPVTQDYFDTTLSPYGNWVQVDGYGRCWRPTTVVYDSSWSPYCDRGHWVYTDCGWYWESDYSWGVTFHYGRWFRDANFGWCWYPDTVWAPSWVAWRSADDYCGWAPLPPFAVFTPGVGFFYRGVSVGLDFDFGLGADSFVFISPGHLCDRRPRSFCVDHAHVGQIFARTTIVNNFNAHGHTIVNTGIPVARINSHLSRPITTVKIASLPSARREGWQGAVTAHQVTSSHEDNVRNYPGATAVGTYQNRGTPVVNQTEERNNQYYNYNNSRPQPNAETRSQAEYNNNNRTVNQYNNVNRSPSYTPPANPTVDYNNNRVDNRYDTRTVPTPTTPAPEQRYNSQPQPEQRVQQTESRPNNGESENRNNNERTQPSQGQSQGGGQGQSHNSNNQNQQNH